MRREVQVILSATVPIYRQVKTELAVWQERQDMLGREYTEDVLVPITLSVKQMQRFVLALQALDKAFCKD